MTARRVSALVVVAVMFVFGLTGTGFATDRIEPPPIPPLPDSYCFPISLWDPLPDGRPCIHLRG